MKVTQEKLRKNRLQNFTTYSRIGAQIHKTLLVGNHGNHGNMATNTLPVTMFVHHSLKLCILPVVHMVHWQLQLCRVFHL